MQSSGRVSPESVADYPPPEYLYLAENNAYVYSTVDSVNT